MTTTPIVLRASKEQTLSVFTQKPPKSPLKPTQTLQPQRLATTHLPHAPEPKQALSLERLGITVKRTSFDRKFVKFER